MVLSTVLLILNCSNFAVSNGIDFEETKNCNKTRKLNFMWKQILMSRRTCLLF